VAAGSVAGGREILQIINDGGEGKSKGHSGYLYMKISTLLSGCNGESRFRHRATITMHITGSRARKLNENAVLM
jgi:hypothetical protein